MAVQRGDAKVVLFTVPKEIRGKFHYSEGGGYLDEPYTEEEKRICDEFVESIRKAEEDTIIEE